MRRTNIRWISFFARKEQQFYERGIKMKIQTFHNYKQTSLKHEARRIAAGNQL